MNATDKLALLVATCKAGVSIDVNDHRNVCQSAAERLEVAATWECPPEIAPEVRQRMIEADTTVIVHFYPQTPVSFYEVWHHDIEAALDEALECLREEGLLR